MSGNNNAIILFLIFFFILAVTITMYYFRCKLFQVECGKCKLFNFSCPDRIPEGTYYCPGVDSSVIVNADGMQIVYGKDKTTIFPYLYDKAAGTVSFSVPSDGSPVNPGVTIAKFDPVKKMFSAQFIPGRLILEYTLNGSPFSSTPPSPSPSPPRSSP